MSFSFLWDWTEMAFLGAVLGMYFSNKTQCEWVNHVCNNLVLLFSEHLVFYLSVCREREREPLLFFKHHEQVLWMCKFFSCALYINITKHHTFSVPANWHKPKTEHSPNPEWPKLNLKSPQIWTNSSDKFTNLFQQSSELLTWLVELWIDPDHANNVEDSGQ